MLPKADHATAAGVCRQPVTESTIPLWRIKDTSVKFI